MAMFPPFFESVENVAGVKAIFGNSPRVYPHGIADQNTRAPYCVFQMITGNPENYLNQLPDMDGYTVQVDVYAESPSEAADGVFGIRAEASAATVR